jgi:hypothetical protein
MISLAFYLVLQISFTLPFYHIIPLLKYIQFPWRLLCLMTPLAIILFIYYFDAASVLFTKTDGKKKVAAWMGTILILQALWNGVNFEFYRYGAFSGEEIRKSMSIENLKGHFNWNEYYPIGFKKKSVSSILENRGLKIISVSDPALLSEVREFDKIHIVLAPGGGTLVFNQIRSPFITMKFSSNINAAGGDYQETVFSQSGDGQNAYIDISKTGLIGLDLLAVKGLIR